MTMDLEAAQAAAESVVHAEALEAFATLQRTLGAMRYPSPDRKAGYSISEVLSQFLHHGPHMVKNHALGTKCGTSWVDRS